MMEDFIIYYGLTLIALVITLGAQGLISFSYSKYKNIKNKTHLTGADAARQILDKHGLSNIYVVETKGNLTDHYDPSRKVIRLSSEVYHEESIASVLIAAHECGHAIQDKEKYTFMKIRSKLVPVVNLASYAGYFSIVIGVIVGILDFIWLGIIMEIIILLFQLITLPVEFDASKRALNNVKEMHLLDSAELDKGKIVLVSAALTYVASVVSAILQILRLVLIYGRKRD